MAGIEQNGVNAKNPRPRGTKPGVEKPVQNQRFGFLVHEEVKEHICSSGRSSGFRDTALTTPSRPI